MDDQNFCPKVFKYCSIIADGMIKIFKERQTIANLNLSPTEKSTKISNFVKFFISNKKIVNYRIH